MPSNATHLIRWIDAIAVQHLTFLMKRTLSQIRNCILFCQFLIIFRPQHGDFNLFISNALLFYVPFFLILAALMVSIPAVSIRRITAVKQTIRHF